MLGAVVIASWFAQAASPAYTQPEPPGPPPPSAPVEGPADGPNTLSVTGRIAYRMSNTGETAGEPAAVGFSVGGALEHRYAKLGDAVELGAALTFAFDHFATVPEDLSSFIALQMAGVHVGLGRVSAGIGGGINVGSGPPGSATVHPVARALARFEVPVRGRTALALMADYTRTLTQAPFGDVFDAGGALLYRF